MCGRYVSRDQAAIEAYFNLSPHQFQITDRYNVAPSTTVPVVRKIDGGRVMHGMHWGLIPRWSKSKKLRYKTFNARAETVATSSAFGPVYRVRRCLIPASGFYEWQRAVDPKIPHYIHKRDDEPMAFAGLWETWKGEDDDTLESCTIVTTEANEMMGELHNRMPVILDPEDFDWWLTGKTEEVGQLLAPCPSEALNVYPISRQVNNPRNEGLELLESVA